MFRVTVIFGFHGKVINKTTLEVIPLPFREAEGLV